MKLLLIIISIVLVTGCAQYVPYEDLNLDTTSNFNSPTEGKAGIYFYQSKYNFVDGIAANLTDASFSIKGHPKEFLNTGEYGYFELLPGDYEYVLSGGVPYDINSHVKLKANHNYFFLISGDYLGSSAHLERNQDNINEIKEFLLNGDYEKNTVDW